MAEDRPEAREATAVFQPTLAPARFPFMPWGLAPLVGLALVLLTGLVPFAFGEIQGATAEATRRVMTEGGYSWASASVSGQWVTLTGTPPSREEADRLVAAVSRARSDTFLGEAEPASMVVEHFTWLDQPFPAVEPNQPMIIVDEPAATPGPAPSTVAEQRCDDSMAGLLGSATIEFASNSSVIRISSNSLLDSIATAAKACPGPLRIEGHTDDVGRDRSNTTLSLRRAEAVRTALIRRGVEAGRLIAEGFGDTRPIANNTTEAGRARNRRIEIRAISASPN
jgi:outer membrane protein OmpA-like peptidoglycan-associated protein